MTIERPDRDMLSAILGGNTKRVKELLAWGVEATTKIDGASFLHHAASTGHHMPVKLLIQAGAKADREALVLAVRSGNRHSCIYVHDNLQDEGHDPFAYSWSSLFVDRGFCEALTPEVAGWLVQSGLDVKETDNFGRSLLDLATQNASEEVVAALQ